MKLATHLRGLEYRELFHQNLVYYQIVAFRHRNNFRITFSSMAVAQLRFQVDNKVIGVAVAM
jgi:hypothetical protein